MAWVPTTQYEGTVGGLRFEYGTVVASTNVEVTTRMREVLAAFATFSADPTDSDSIYIDRTITDGAVTLGSDFDGTLNYLFIGR